MKFSKAVCDAEKASAAEIAEFIPRTGEFRGVNLQFEVFTSSDLCREDQDTVWDILVNNMDEISANSSLSWRLLSNRRQTFHKMARFIIVREKVDGNELDPGPIVGFTMFRFETEDEEDILYCYELHLTKGILRKGLGTFLLQQLAEIGKHWNMSKIMLTVLKCNTAAFQFYRAAGFVVDPTSPTYVQPGEVDEGEEYEYDIISMTL